MPGAAPVVWALIAIAANANVLTKLQNPGISLLAS
jgi:hypothetical protein